MNAQQRNLEKKKKSIFVMVSGINYVSQLLYELNGYRYILCVVEYIPFHPF